MSRPRLVALDELSAPHRQQDTTAQPQPHTKKSRANLEHRRDGLDDDPEAPSRGDLNVDMEAIQRVGRVFENEPVAYLSKRLLVRAANLHHEGELSTVMELRVRPSLVGSDRRVKKIEHMDAVPQLRVLDLSGHWVERLSGLSVLRQLRELNLSNNRISCIENLELLTQLEVLDLNDNRIERIPSSMRHLKNLATLRLARNELSTLRDVVHLAPLANLTSLALFGNPMSELQHAREFVVYSLPTVGRLDSHAVSRTERQRASQRFDRSETERLREDMQLGQEALRDLQAALTVEQERSASLERELEQAREHIEKCEADVGKAREELEAKAAMYEEQGRSLAHTTKLLAETRQEFAFYKIDHPWPGRKAATPQEDGEEEEEEESIALPLREHALPVVDYRAIPPYSPSAVFNDGELNRAFSRFVEMDAELHSLYYEVKQLQEQLDAVRDSAAPPEVQELLRTLLERRDELQRVNAAISTAQNELDQQRFGGRSSADVSAAERELAALEAQRQVCESEVSRCSTALEQHQAQRAQDDGKAAERGKKCAAIEHELEACKERRAALEQDRDRAQQVLLSQLRDAFGHDEAFAHVELEEAVSSRERAEAALEHLRAEAKERIQRLESAFGRAITRAEDAEAEVRSLEGEVMRLREQEAEARTAGDEQGEEREEDEVDDVAVDDSGDQTQVLLDRLHQMKAEVKASMEREEARRAEERQHLESVLATKDQRLKAELALQEERLRELFDRELQERLEEQRRELTRKSQGGGQTQDPPRTRDDLEAASRIPLQASVMQLMLEEEALTSAVEQLQHEEASLIDSIRSLKRALRGEEQQAERVRTRLCDELEGLADQIKEQKRALEDAQQAGAEAHAELDSISKDVDDCRAVVQRLRLEEQALHDSIGERKIELERLEGQQHREKQRNRREVPAQEEHLQRVIAALHTERAGLEARVEQLRGDVEQLRTEQSELEQRQLGEAQAQVQALEQRRARVQKQLQLEEAELKAKIERQRGVLERLTQQAEQRESDPVADGRTRHIEVTRASLTAASGALREVAERRDRAEREAAAAAERLAQLEQRAESVRSEISNAEHTLGVMSISVNSHRDELARLQLQKRVLEKETEQVRQDADRIERMHELRVALISSGDAPSGEARRLVEAWQATHSSLLQRLEELVELMHYTERQHADFVERGEQLGDVDADEALEAWKREAEDASARLREIGEKQHALGELVRFMHGFLEAFEASVEEEEEVEVVVEPQEEEEVELHEEAERSVPVENPWNVIIAQAQTIEELTLELHELRDEAPSRRKEEEVAAAAAPPAPRQPVPHARDMAKARATLKSLLHASQQAADSVSRAQSELTRLQEECRVKQDRFAELTTQVAQLEEEAQVDSTRWRSEALALREQLDGERLQHEEEMAALSSALSRCRAELSAARSEHERALRLSNGIVFKWEDGEAMRAELKDMLSEIQTGLRDLQRQREAAMEEEEVRAEEQVASVRAGKLQERVGMLERQLDEERRLREEAVRASVGRPDGGSTKARMGELTPAPAHMRRPAANLSEEDENEDESTVRRGEASMFREAAEDDEEPEEDGTSARQRMLQEVDDPWASEEEEEEEEAVVEENEDGVQASVLESIAANLDEALSLFVSRVDSVSDRSEQRRRSRLVEFSSAEEEEEEQEEEEEEVRAKPPARRAGAPASKSKRRKSKGRRSVRRKKVQRKAKKSKPKLKPTTTRKKKKPKKQQPARSPARAHSTPKTRHFNIDMELDLSPQRGSRSSRRSFRASARTHLDEYWMSPPPADMDRRVRELHARVLGRSSRRA